MAERRAGHETGVSDVQCLTGPDFWHALRDADGWSRDLEDAALEVAAHAPGPVREHYASQIASAPQDGGPNEPALFRVRHRDGLRVTVLMLNGYVTQRGAAVRLKGEGAPLATCFTQARRQPVWHFDHQVDLIERMVLSGRPPYPVERTLLTSGLIDAVMTSRYQSGALLETPHLAAISYAPEPPPPYYERSFVPAGWTRSGPLQHLPPQ